MSVADKTARASATARILMAIYRYRPLCLYAVLWIAYRVSPLLRPLLRERLGMCAPPAGQGPVIWFHGSSVGEVSSIGPVVAEIRKRVPGCRIMVTTMTITGKKRAARELEGVAALVVPLDFFPAVRRFVTRLRPSVLIVGETEIWPNLVAETRKLGAAVILVNGRISNKSFPRYRLIKPLVGHVLAQFDLLLMRAEVDAGRIARLGGSRTKVVTVGNTKVDILPQPLPAEARTLVRQRLGIETQRLVISLGSARSGETETLLDAVVAAFGRPRPLVIIAPRHIGNAPQVEEACRRRDLSFITVSEASPPGHADADTDVIIIAQMGRLLEVYAISDIAIVGGTFKPIGGHNPLEPASQGAVTVVGPHIHNIADDIEFLRSQGVALMTDEAGLAGLLHDLAGNAGKRREIAGRAIEVVRNRTGIAARCVDIMAERGLLP
jgi:3-deoxy-D-manno-octulosonic-acid transferase